MKEIQSQSTSPAPSSRSSLSPSPSLPITAADWADSFQIPWVKWPEALMQGLGRGKGQAHSYLGDLLGMGLSAELVYGTSCEEQSTLGLGDNVNLDKRLLSPVLSR